MKRYIVFAGVNGSGKSTLYQMQKNLINMPRINTDEILREFGDWRNISDLMKAGKIAVRRLNEYLVGGITFNQETTLCGKSIIKTIEKAKRLGYCIELHYVGVDSVDIAIKRVELRVSRGGHGIPIEDIERRYIETFRNLNNIMPLCDLVALYDNTTEFRRFAIYKNDKLIRLSDNVPNWYNKIGGS